MSDLDKAVKALRRLKKPKAMVKVYERFGPVLYNEARSQVEFERYLQLNAGEDNDVSRTKATRREISR